MSSPIKLYTLCIDAYPETPELASLLTGRGLTRSELICAGAFTCATITSMISGTIGTQIIKDGIGYHTMYKPEFTSWRSNKCNSDLLPQVSLPSRECNSDLLPQVSLPSRECNSDLLPSRKCIIERMLQKNMDIIVHNHVPWFSKVLCGKMIPDHEKNKHYRDHAVNDDGVEVKPFGVIKSESNITYSSTNPEMTLNTFIKWNFSDNKHQFYSNEKEYITYIQNKSFHGLFFTDLCHWHEYCYYPNGQITSNEKITKSDALNNSIEWLSNWNFDEPNSIFFIFADHSHRVQSYLDPPSYITWVYFKNNVNNMPLEPIISSCDFYYLVEDIFNLEKTSHEFSGIYACEDGRANSVVKDKANAFNRGCLINDFYLSVTKLTDEINHPIGIYVMLTKLTNKNMYSVYLFTLDFNATSSPIEKFSIICKDALSDPVKVNDSIFILDDTMMDKAMQLFLMIP